MSNYMEYNDKIAFHPGYYIKELVHESGLTQEDYAKRLDTTPKNLSILIKGDQSLSIDIAVKLSRITGTSVSYWLNLQKTYDSLIAEFESEKELKAERDVFAYLDYKYFRDHFGLPDLPRKKDEQIREVREFLRVSTLSVLRKRDMAVSFRNTGDDLTEANIVKANVMVQIAVNQALGTETPKFNKKKFQDSAEYACNLTRHHEDFYPLIYHAFRESGVVFVILPNIPGSKTNGATKKIGNKIMLMVNDRRLNADTFWFTLFHEIGHIIYDDLGISFDQESGEKEEKANRYAQDHLIPPEKYKEFLENKNFDVKSIKKFADDIDRDPGIVLGRLQKEGFVGYDDPKTNALRRRYQVKVNYFNRK